MPTMGRPTTFNQSQFDNVTIKRNAPAAQANLKELSPKEKERLLNKISGYKPKNDLYVDGKTHNKMGKDEFLKLLTVQLQNQDPMKPMEQNKMAAELAQFSQLEQLSNLNTKFDSFNKNAKIEDKFYGASFLGKEVVTNGTSLNFEGEGTDADILFSLPKPSSKALVRIFDKNNSMVGEMWRENMGRGNQTITWDGTTLDGSVTNKGEYRVQVFAWDQFAEPIEVQTKAKGLVESVFFENGETMLLVDGKKIFLRDVDSFHVPGKSEKIDFKKEGPQVSTALAGVEAKSPGQNLPVAQNIQPQVNLNKTNKADGLKSYNKVSTGITDVYDVE